MSTLHLPQHLNDLHFLGRVISHLEHADDILLMSTSLNVLIRGLKQIEGNMISRTFPGIQKLHVKHMSKPSKITSSTVVQLNEDQQPYSV